MKQARMTPLSIVTSASSSAPRRHRRRQPSSSRLRVICCYLFPTLVCGEQAVVVCKGGGGGGCGGVDGWMDGRRGEVYRMLLLVQGGYLPAQVTGVLQSPTKSCEVVRTLLLDRGSYLYIYTQLTRVLRSPGKFLGRRCKFEEVISTFTTYRSPTKFCEVFRT